MGTSTTNRVFSNINTINNWMKNSMEDDVLLFILRDIVLRILKMRKLFNIF